ncbi:hypothetical protein PCASD_24511 [Puccinia coronata f. sp. avenae]|uniref:Uncharacterized protein n=1 Tax=Puccinia coronata f. sp. avenae TaxID=200324 RepID=A0A2N5S8X0_9BASI|nr:hypothetical protein PCASD_24511 [Puccinia coronata f. sp. avenae]
MSYELIGQWLFDMGSNTLSNPTLKKSVEKPCPTWDWTEGSNPMSDKMVGLACPTQHQTILSDAVSDKPTGWVFFRGAELVVLGTPSLMTPSHQHLSTNTVTHHHLTTHPIQHHQIKSKCASILNGNSSSETFSFSTYIITPTIWMIKYYQFLNPAENTLNCNRMSLIFFLSPAPATQGL